MATLDRSNPHGQAAGANFVPAATGLDLRLTAAAAYVVDIDTSLPLLGWRPRAKHAPASLAKMMTALVVRRRVSLNEVVIVKPEDLVGHTQSRAGIQAGDVFTVEQLLYAALLPSGNDAALALARFVGSKALSLTNGTARAHLQAFVNEMNHLAGELGLTDTHFTNPTGLDDPGQHTSARDVTTMASALLKDLDLRRIVASQEYLVRSGRSGMAGRPVRLRNTNKLLGKNGVLGVKTGTTDAAGCCLVVAKELCNGHLVIASVLGSRPGGGRYADALAVLELAQSLA